MIDRKNICEVLEKIEKSMETSPYVSTLRDPFKILVATVISARTKDEVTEKVSGRLFSRAKNFEDLLKMSEEEIARLIYPAGFYRNKARILKRLAEVIVKEYGGKVPSSLDELLKLPGVGRKTANLVLITAFGKDGICVDTHVHRIVNRWGFVRTKSPEETEMELRKKLPRKCWKKINRVLVPFGRKVCRPISPFCSSCPISDLCPKIGVERKR